MIIKRKCFSLFDNFGIDKKPITLDEVEKLNKIYPGFIDNSHEDLTKNSKLGEKLNNYSAWKVFKNNKYKLLGVRPISDMNSNSTAKNYYLYFDSSTQIDLDELKGMGLFTYDDLIERRKGGSTSKNPNVSLFGKKIIFYDGVGRFNSFNLNELNRRVKLDDFYKAIYEYENEFGDKLSLNDVKRRMKLGEIVWDGIDNVLFIYFENSTTGLNYSFLFKSPNDKVEVGEVSD